MRLKSFERRSYRYNPSPDEIVTEAFELIRAGVVNLWTVNHCICTFNESTLDFFLSENMAYRFGAQLAIETYKGNYAVVPQQMIRQFSENNFKDVIQQFNNDFAPGEEFIYIEKYAPRKYRNPEFSISGELFFCSCLGCSNEVTREDALCFFCQEAGCTPFGKPCLIQDFQGLRNPLKHWNPSF
jgi:hypothetical protein